jgi:hypothetical protein
MSSDAYYQTVVGMCATQDSHSWRDTALVSATAQREVSLELEITTQQFCDQAKYAMQNIDLLCIYI